MSKFNQVKWLDAFSARASKELRKLKIPRATTKDFEDGIRMFGDHIGRRTIAADHLIENQGAGLVVGAEMVERIRAIKIDGAIERGGWHLPWKGLSLGFKAGSSLPPARVLYATRAEINAEMQHFNTMIPDGKDQDKFLAIFIATTESEVVSGVQYNDFPAVASAILAPSDVQKYMRSRQLHPSDSTSSWLDEQEQSELYAVTQFVIALGIYLSLDGAELTPIPARSLWAPRKPLKRMYALNDRVPKFNAPDNHDSNGRKMHVVSEFVRQLRDERYYKGKWQDWPRGSRYVLVQTHARGNLVQADFEGKS